MMRSLWQSAKFLKYKNYGRAAITTFIRKESTQNLLNVSPDKERTDIAIVTLQRPPVNTLSLELLQELSKTLDNLTNSDFKAMIITSASSKVFSAGIDMSEIVYKGDTSRAELFWTTLQDVWLKLLESRLITTAAVNGHAPAGGCLLAMSCEYRAMVGSKYTIGMNETAFGIVPSTIFMQCMNSVVSRRQSELALVLGTLFTADEALKVGIIDDIAIDKEEAINKCKTFISRFDKVNPNARYLTKLKFKSQSTGWLKNDRQADLQEFIQLLKSPVIQKALNDYIKSLKSKNK